MDARNFTYLCYGLTVAWAIVVLYIISLAMRERRLNEELERVKRMVEDREREKAVRR